MDKYIVSIANQTIEVWAKDHESAMKKAINKDTGTKKVFAVLSGCLKYGDDEDEEYLFHVGFMKNNGYFDGMDYELIN